MGKGDKKSKRGKIIMGSHGVRRPGKKATYKVPVIVAEKEIPVKVQKEKPVAKPKAEADDTLPVDVQVVETAEKPAKKKSAPKVKD